MCRQHPEVTIAREMLKFYSPVGRPNSVICIFIGTSSDSCVMCRRYLDLLEQECLPPVPEHPLRPAPERRSVCFVLSNFHQRPLGWQMPEGASSVIMEKMTQGLERELDIMVQRLRSAWGYRKRKPKPKPIAESEEKEDCASWRRFVSRSRPSGVGPYRRWGRKDTLAAAEAGEGEEVTKTGRGEARAIENTEGEKVVEGESDD